MTFWSDRSNGALAPFGWAVAAGWSRNGTAQTASVDVTAITLMRSLEQRMARSFEVETPEWGGSPTPPRRSTEYSYINNPSGPDLLQGEDEHRGAGGEVLDLRPERRIETQDQRAETTGHGDVLLAVHGVADRAASMAGARAEVPELLAGVAIVGAHHALDVPVDDDPAGRGEHAADRRVLVVHGPLALAGHGVARVEMPVRLTARRVLRHLVAAEEQGRRRFRDRRLLLDGDLLAHLHRGVVPELGLRVVGARVPAPSPRDPRADELRLADLARRIAADQLAGLGVDPLDPVIDEVHRPDVLDLAVGAVVHEDEAALVLVDEELLAVAVEDQALAEPRVVVPVVVRDLLVIPLELPGIGIQGEHGGSVEVVAGASASPVVVGSGVGGAPVDEVERRIERAGHPPAAAPELARVPSPALRVILDGVELPDLLAVVRVDPEDLPLDGILSRGLPQDQLVLDHEGRAREVAAALLGVEEGRGPGLLAGLHVQRDDPAIQGPEVDLAVPGRHPPVVRREEERARDRVELGVVVPDLLARRRVQGEDAVVGRDVVHDAVDHEGRGLQPLEHRARLVDPRHRQVLHVRLVDLPEGAVAVRLVGPVVHRPVVRIVGQQPGRAHLGGREGGKRESYAEQHQCERQRPRRPRPHGLFSFLSGWRQPQDTSLVSRCEGCQAPVLYERSRGAVNSRLLPLGPTPGARRLAAGPRAGAPAPSACSGPTVR